MHSQSFLTLTLFVSIFVLSVSADTAVNDHQNKCFLEGLSILAKCNKVQSVHSFANGNTYTPEECCLYKVYSDCVKEKVNESPCMETLKVEYNTQLDTILATKCFNVNCSNVA